MGRKKSKAAKAKDRKISRKPLASNEPSGSKPPGPKSSGYKIVGSFIRPSEKSPEEKKREVTEKFSEVLMSTLEMFNYNQKNNIPAEILMLIYAKSRWMKQPKVLAPSWVKQFNKFGRIDGPGFNHMRRDFRILYKHTSACKRGFEKFIKKFPCESDPKSRSFPVISKKRFFARKGGSISKKNVKTESVLKQNIQLGQSTSKQNVENEEDEDEDDFDDDDSSEEEYDSFDLPSSLLTELQRDCIKKSVAANIALEIVCSPETQITLKRLLIFEKHQLVTEWEIAKKIYCLQNISWEIMPGMINLCDEIAKEMIEIDRALEAIHCLGRYEMAAKLLSILRKSIKARLRKKSAKKEETEVHSEENETEESEESADSETEESDESEDDEAEESDESGDDEAEESDESDDDDEAEKSEEFEVTLDNDSSEDIEELKSVIDEKEQKEMIKVKKHMTTTFLDLLRATKFFAEIRNVDEKEIDRMGQLNYKFYEMLSSMTQTY
ncbi:unnamed protein product [Cercopithifilaria johnstoni]|uniref:Uncharacterized protein n=1 Tax=Cercopithifilaria johnstoni TaxID=2874296 RepID=A0A8J2M310_9BILA|nr:unnamed protein product [Cercopithifilaria johnstoni]